MKRLSRATVQELIVSAASSPRLRSNENIHPSLDDPVQRFVNAMEPGTYVRPHRHQQEGRWELFVIISGAAAVLLFDDEGRVTERVEMSTENGSDRCRGAAMQVARCGVLGIRYLALRGETGTICQTDGQGLRRLGSSRGALR